MSALPPNFKEDLADLESAEDFLTYFGIAFDPRTVRINRLHILQRFHNYLNGAGNPEDFEVWKSLLARAYQDYVESDALTEGVFSVFKRARGIQTVAISSIGRRQS